MRTLLSFSLLLLFFASVQSCQRRNQADWTIGTDNNLAENTLQDVFSQADEVLKSSGQTTNTCISFITFDDEPGVYPDTIRIGFNNQICRDGLRRDGVLVLYLSEPWRQAGSTLDIVSEGYTVNGHLFVGSKFLTNTSTGAALQYSSEVRNARIFSADGQDSITWSSNKTVEQIEGIGTDFLSDGLNGILDDAYSIEGSGSGISRNGTAFTASIREPLIRRLNCRWLVQGILDVDAQNVRQGYSLDFGQGTCDAEAMLTWGRFSRQVLLWQ